MVDKTNSKSKVNLRVGMTITESVTLGHFSQPCGQVSGGAGEESDKAAAPCPFKISLHWGYMLEAQQRNPQLSGSGWNVLPLSPAFTLLKDALWLASPVQGGERHIILAETILQMAFQMNEQDLTVSAFLFILIHYLWIFLQTEEWIGPAGLKVWADEHSILRDNRR